MLCTDIVLTFRTISVHNMFSPSFPKRRASDKDLPVQRLFLNTKLLQSSGILFQGYFFQSPVIYRDLFSKTFQTETMGMTLNV